VLLVLAVLASAFGAFQYDVPRRLGWGDRADAPEVIAPPSGLDLPSFAAPVRVADPIVPTVADPEAIKALLAPILRDHHLGGHVVAAVADVSGRILFRGGTAGGSTAATPASTTKLVTAVAALEDLGPDHTFRTRVVNGAKAGQIVLVGGGDPYLAARPIADDDHTPAPADLQTLARKTAAALKTAGHTSVSLGFDDSLFTGPTVNPTWPATNTAEGVVAPITALWADQGAQADGTGVVDDPSQRAAQVFAQALKKAGIKVTAAPRRTEAAAGATEIAGMDSARLDEITANILAISDNDGAEVLAHQVGIAEGFGGSYEGGVQGVSAVITRLGHPFQSGDRLYDGSGLSHEDRLTPDTLINMLALGADPDHPELRTVVTALPVAGFTGSLADRYEKGPVGGRGRVSAKTGTLMGVHGLAGVATTQGGATLLFVFIADDVPVEDTLAARDVLDVLTSTLGACLCS
jgi:D-alanyl-D-alanine carboxypeptidase/D-alanyl-D-alanine-endopeptidase (penicillin-binding protein 4)